MKYVAKFSTFDSALVSQGDLLSLKEDGTLVHGYQGLDWQEAPSKEILAISQSLSKISQNGDGTFWAEVTIDSETGQVTKTGLYEYYSGGSGYGHAKAVKAVV